uniref:ATP synthase complex subunit 8 n=1 Tax=Galerucella sp. EMHAU-15070821 TaxID=2480061 RepID=A0A3G2EYS7_9CUCU|nr:ATP synthase F0 subunit 8 [Galerucella sp. EMHAU-15070821]
MPQMMPLNWLTLMIFFILILFTFNNLNYFVYLKNQTYCKFNLKKLKFNWKWL